MSELHEQRERMVEEQIAARGVRDRRVLDALRRVPREAFLPEELREFAYEDTPLPIGSGQTISQPLIVAIMTEALELPPDAERTVVLEIGTGSGYAAAVLAEIAGRVVTVERFATLAETARARLQQAGYDNVEVIHGDGSLGHPAAAPYDGILVAAGGPDVPESLRRQLAVGAHLVIPVGPTPREQELVRVTREGPDAWHRESLGGVRFVPLVGEEGWAEDEGVVPAGAAPTARPAPPEEAPQAIARCAEPFDRIEEARLEPLLERIGDARVVLLGEASHGTSEFYRMRAHITRALIERKGFDIVAVEADWPDAARIDHWTRRFEDLPAEWADWAAFARFPTWMWRNVEVREFVDWLREHNAGVAPERRTGFYGLDLYSLYTSIQSVLEYLEAVDPEAAAVARRRYGCLSPFEGDPASYGAAAMRGGFRGCEREVTRMLRDLLDKRMQYRFHDGERFRDAVQNARLVADAEQYYRAMYYGAAESWNLRDRHMFETLQALLAFRGGDARAVVWEHNSHVGDATATEMSARGELNVGQLCREAFGRDAYIVGFGTHTGTVAAASHWDGPMEVKDVVPSHEKSYEHACHASGVARFLLDLHGDAREPLMEPRLERAIGVIYRPESELASHYFHAILPRQFDEYVWVDRSHAVTPLEAEQLSGTPDTYPFAL